jgi:hypothetical protein
MVCSHCHRKIHYGLIEVEDRVYFDESVIVSWKETWKKSNHSRKGIPKVKEPCCNCGKLVDPGNMKRYHGEKCKSIPA